MWCDYQGLKGKERKGKKRKGEAILGFQRGDYLWPTSTSTSTSTQHFSRNKFTFIHTCLWVDLLLFRACTLFYLFIYLSFQREAGFNSPRIKLTSQSCWENLRGLTDWTSDYTLSYAPKEAACTNKLSLFYGNSYLICIFFSYK